MSTRRARYATFVRGINLGRHRRVSSTELGSHFEKLGLGDVATFRTSGNVVFEAGGESANKLKKRIEQRLEGKLGYEVTIFLRTASQVRAIATHEPFPRTAVESSKGKLQVLILPAKPATQKRKDVLALATGEDELAFGDRELYWLPSGGTRDSGLDLQAIEGLIGPTTMRTKSTIEQLVTKYFAG